MIRDGGGGGGGVIHALNRHSDANLPTQRRMHVFGAALMLYRGGFKLAWSAARDPFIRWQNSQIQISNQKNGMRGEDRADGA